MIILKEFRPALLLTLMLFALCGLAYPYALTGVSQLVAAEKAEGSLIVVNGKAVGSHIIGQGFTDPRFMKSRPSAVNYNVYTAAEKADGTYTGVSSGSKNYGNSNPELALRVKNDLTAFLAANPTVKAENIPTDLLTASGSGLDPHISPAAAQVQLAALAENTGLPREQLELMVKNNTSGKIAGVLGEARVNVLQVNLEIARALGLLPKGV